MIDQLLVEYLVNAVWQVPLLALAAWSLLKLTRLGPLGEHRVWLGVLLVCTVLPLSGIAPAPRTSSASTAHALLSSIPSLPALDAADNGTLASAPTDASISQDEAPRGTSNFHAYLHTFELSARTVRVVAWTYASLVSLAMLRLVFSWLSAHRLRIKSTAYAVEAEELARWKDLAAGLGVSLPPVRWSADITSPVVLGALRPVLMLPFDFWRCSKAEQRAAISHELAHVARRDCLLHLCCEIVSLPLAWHPVTHGIGQRISRTREMVCDQIAARVMRSEVIYARCLVGLAARMLGTRADRFAVQGMGLFRSSKLEERVMKLTEVKQGMGVRELWLRRVGTLAAMGLFVGAVASVHLAPVLAYQAQAPAPPELPVPPALPSPSAAPVPPAAPAPPAPFQGTVPPPPAVTADPVAPLAPSMPPPPTSPAEQTIAPPPAPPEKPAHLRAVPHRQEHPFVTLDDQATILTLEQKHRIEAETRRALDQAQRELARAQTDIQKQVKTQINGPEFKAQMERMKKDLTGHSAEMAQAQAEMAKAMAQFSSPEFKAEIGKFNTPEFQKQLQEQMKTSRESIDREMARVNSPEFQKQIAEATRHAITPEVEKQIAEAEKQVAEALKRLDEAQAKAH